MEDELILDVIKSYMQTEIANQLEFFEDAIVVLLENGTKIKITTNNVA